jgi:hypothetical protein
MTKSFHKNPTISEIVNKITLENDQSDFTNETERRPTKLFEITTDKDTEIIETNDFSETPVDTQVGMELDKDIEELEATTETISVLSQFSTSLEAAVFPDKALAALCNAINYSFESKIHGYRDSQVCVSVEGLSIAIENDSPNEVVEEKKEESKNKLIEWFKKLYERFTSFMSNIWNKIKEWVGGLFDSTKKLKNQVDNMNKLLGNIKTAAKSNKIELKPKLINALSMFNTTPTNNKDVVNVMENTLATVNYAVTALPPVINKSQKSIAAMEDTIGEVDTNGSVFLRTLRESQPGFAWPQSKNFNSLLSTKSEKVTKKIGNQDVDVEIISNRCAMCGNHVLIAEMPMPIDLDTLNNKMENTHSDLVLSFTAYLFQNTKLYVTKTNSEEFKKDLPNGIPTEFKKAENGVEFDVATVSDLTKLNKINTDIVNKIADFRKIDLASASKFNLSKTKSKIRSIAKSEQFKKDATAWCQLMTNTVSMITGLKAVANIGLNSVRINLNYIQTMLNCYNTSSEASK